MDEAPPSAPSELETRVLVFRSAGLLCAFPLPDVREIVFMAQLWRPPGMPTVLEGILNLRGTVVPIVHFTRLFGLPEQPSGLHTPLIILEGPSGPTGVLVDAVSHILSTSDVSRLQVRAKYTFNECLTAEIEGNGSVIHLLSPQRILLEQEQRSVAEFQATSQIRLDALQPSQS